MPLSLNRNFCAIALSGLAFLAACAPVPQSAPTPPPAAAEPATEAALPPDLQQEGKPLPRVDVRLLKCSTLNSATDDDKAYAATFMLGYRAALMGSHIVDTKRIDAVEQTALADCASHPEAIATKIFAVALFKVERAERLEKAAERAETAAARAAEKAGMPEPPMRYTRRRAPPGSIPAADQSSPGQPPAEQTPAMQTPAVQTPTGQTPAAPPSDQAPAQQSKPAEPAPPAEQAPPADQPAPAHEPPAPTTPTTMPEQPSK
jgi:hypothetical protein